MAHDHRFFDQAQGSRLSQYPSNDALLWPQSFEVEVGLFFQQGLESSERTDADRSDGRMHLARFRGFPASVPS